MTPDRSRHITSRAAKLHRTQRYHVRANFLGVISMVCPCCGSIQKRHLMQRQYVVRCTNCEAKYVPKLTLMLVPGGGRRAIPPDFIIPDKNGKSTVLQEAFPVGDMEHWRNGGCTHEMVVSGRGAGGEERESGDDGLTPSEVIESLRVLTAKAVNEQGVRTETGLLFAVKTWAAENSVDLAGDWGNGWTRRLG